MRCQVQTIIPHLRRSASHRKYFLFLGCFLCAKNRISVLELQNNPGFVVEQQARQSAQLEMIRLMGALTTNLSNQFKAPQGLKLWSLLPMGATYFMCNFSPNYLHLLYRSTLSFSNYVNENFDILKEQGTDLYPRDRAYWLIDCFKSS